MGDAAITHRVAALCVGNELGPQIGFDPGLLPVAGLVHVTGVSGVDTITGKVVAELTAGLPTTVDLSPFRGARFQVPGQISRLRRGYAASRLSIE
jgi:glycine/D-amino acid oxidase-like deaminating enzyme